jgi:hypothetical protein
VRSVLTVTVANSDTMLTTLNRVKLELDITGADTQRDMLLNLKILEASDDIEAALGFTVRRETVQETFWHEASDYAPEYLVLDRTPVSMITSVTVDDIPADVSRYRLDAATGQLYALDPAGHPGRWLFWKSIVVAYAGGYILPAESHSNLPNGIQGACVELMSDYWAAKGRDPSVRSEEVPGVGTIQYWVGTVGDPGQLPPRVVMKLAPFRRAVV